MYKAIADDGWKLGDALSFQLTSEMHLVVPSQSPVATSLHYSEISKALFVAGETSFKVILSLPLFDFSCQPWIVRINTDKLDEYPILSVHLSSQPSSPVPYSVQTILSPQPASPVKINSLCAASACPGIILFASLTELICSLCY